MVLRPDRQDMARAIFEKWELDFAVIGHLTDTGRIVVRHKGAVEADIPLAPPGRAGAAVSPPAHPPPPPAPLGDVDPPLGMGDALMELIGCPICARARGSGISTTRLGRTDRQAAGRRRRRRCAVGRHARALALTTDCTPRYCAPTPAPAGCRRWRRRGATSPPSAPPARRHRQHELRQSEKPEIMGQFAAAIEGMAEACRALDFPVVSGNVSLYNETRAVPSCPRRPSADWGCWRTRRRRSASRRRPRRP